MRDVQHEHLFEYGREKKKKTKNKKLVQSVAVTHPGCNEGGNLRGAGILVGRGLDEHVDGGGQVEPETDPVVDQFLSSWNELHTPIGGAFNADGTYAERDLQTWSWR